LEQRDFEFATAFSKDSPMQRRVRTIVVLATILLAVQAQSGEPPKDFTNSIGMKFKLIPAGEFLMGAPAADSNALEDERPQHIVRITRPLYLGATEVTQKQYLRVMNANPSRTQNNTLPVDGVSWNDAVEFCRRLSKIDGRIYRLPTEAEWEYACRAGSKTHFSSADGGKGLRDIAWFKENSEGNTHTVGSKKPNAWGLHDMHGNVLEWCSDSYRSDYYSDSPTGDPRGTGADYDNRVCRGGNFAFPANHCRSSARFHFPKEFRTSKLGWLGFRVALDLIRPEGSPDEKIP
jgi:formylglycine-generating enzyme required for sulfatase activity